MNCFLKGGLKSLPFLLIAAYKAKGMTVYSVVYFYKSVYFKKQNVFWRIYFTSA